MIKVSTVSLTLTVCLMVVLCLCFIGNTSARSIAIKNRAGGDLTLVIDFGKGKDSSSSSEKKKQELPAVDETTKKVIDKVQDVISSSEEKQIAESLLTFANEIRQVSSWQQLH